jgi:antitoxin VapB
MIKIGLCSVLHLGVSMRTVSIFRNKANQAIRIPKDMQFEGVTELEIRREGDTLLLRPSRSSWMSFSNEPLADEDFLVERENLFQSDRFDLSDVKDSHKGSGE